MSSSFRLGTGRSQALSLRPKILSHFRVSVRARARSLECRFKVYVCTNIEVRHNLLSLLVLVLRHALLTLAIIREPSDKIK
ncbi:hypothetical protein KC321_g55 [Hortaea werneckii]|nr:hypothetical protein KC321_g55 [Hortaea werneckii]